MRRHLELANFCSVVDRYYVNFSSVCTFGFSLSDFCPAFYLNYIDASFINTGQFGQRLERVTDSQYAVLISTFVNIYALSTSLNNLPL